MHEDAERTLATWTAHRRIIDDLIAADRGISGSAGDSVLAEFASVVDGFTARRASSRRSRKPTERSTFQHGQQTA